MGKIFLMLTCLLLTACVIAQPDYMVNPTPDESLYMEKVRAQPLEFELPEADAAVAWGRAQSFIGQYSSMKLQIVTDYVIQTYNPTHDTYHRNYGYYVTKTPSEGSVKMSVQCIGYYQWGMDGRPYPAIDLNAHILAHYLKTGELPYPHLIDR